ncbi:calcineurin-binding protein cabin-1-like [Epargyreus clarus]|uniref:calcineurin-binding protein cabin-1-like n=1 Tax=Epargyreus clarus TaxID=520877 RepID=UPI003C2CB29D
MIKLSALNDESDEESGSEERVSREAPEEIAFQQYAKALDLQRKGNLADATTLLKDLLDTELLYDVKTSVPGEKVPSPLLNLKYLCYKNLAGMLSSAGELEPAIDAYRSASELDGTDVTLWHRLGLLYMRANRYEMALSAFQCGVDCNPRHWPCIDKVVTLLLGLDLRKECIAMIFDALQLDPGYMRAIVYRQHIYTKYKFERDYLEYINPRYVWNEAEDDPVDEEIAEKLLKEAERIHDIFIEQQRAERFKYIIPHLKLQKPITQLTWKAVGTALVDMHHYMTENCYSHACPLIMAVSIEKKEEKMEICEEEGKPDMVESKSEENITDVEKITDICSENENNDVSDRDKPTTDTEKVESDLESTQEQKSQKKNTVRRRGSDLRHLQQWEWCNNRRSGRKKRKDDTIYDTLRRMVPSGLVPEIIKKTNNEDKGNCHITAYLGNLFEEKNKEEMPKVEYFGSEDEQKDVQLFINKFSEKNYDIIDILKVYLAILAGKWRIKWSNDLIKVFIEANKCYNNHIDIPACTDDNKAEILHYVAVNLLTEEFILNEKLNLSTDENKTHGLSVIESIGIILSLKPLMFGAVDHLEYTLRQIWVKIHVHLLSKCNALELDSRFELLYVFNDLQHRRDYYNLNVINFTYKPDINIDEILESINFIERNMKLERVEDLYSKGSYEEVIAIVTDTFEHFKTLAKGQEDEVSLDFAVYLTIILDTYWALDKAEDCFKWSFICLHEALKHYFRNTSGSAEYEKWTLTVVKILCSIEHILVSEGLSCLDWIMPKELSQGLEDLIRIIGHQIETTATEMPFDTVIPWILMHYILQREEDQGRGRSATDPEISDEIPYPLMVLFIGHEQLGLKYWCSKSDSKLLYFILDTVVPRLRSPSLSKSIETISQFLEQCVYCLYRHPSRIQKFKYLNDHKSTEKSLDWHRAQQLYEIFRPLELPALEGKVSKITAETEALFIQILALLPPEYDPAKYVVEMERYMNGTDEKLPVFPTLLPYKMKDIYFLLGDYNFKKEESDIGIKYSTLDVIINNNRYESWAQISLAMAVKLVRLLNSCKNLKNDKEFLDPAKTAIRCFKRSLQLNPSRKDLWTEYGSFVYAVHSFSSRLLKQASESLSMEDFESLEKQKEDMLDTTQKCFSTILSEMNKTNDNEMTNEEIWQVYYMLGKVAEKRSKPPSVYLDYYMRGIKFLQEVQATYPTKINYSTPTHLCIEVLELHYRIHASILKYIEQHENKPIPASVGKVFSACIEEWLQGPYTRRKRQEGNKAEGDFRSDEPVQAANILKRSISDAGEEDTHEVKRLKSESAAAKVRRSVSYDTERTVVKEMPVENVPQNVEQDAVVDKVVEINDTQKTVVLDESTNDQNVSEKCKKKEEETEKSQSIVPGKKEESSSSTSSTSSSDSSSSDSTSDSSSDSARESDTSSKSSNESKPLTDDEIMKIVSACLDALEDCASRFPQHYKAIYRLAHYHFYYKKGKDIERCRDLMLLTFTSRFGQKLAGLFSERKNTNFFNNIWKIPSSEVDRGGSFAFHMNRSVLLTMEILKEIDDHTTLQELSFYLQKVPDLGKQYLRDSDREELAQQAFSLCVQSLKGQLIKFSQQADIKTNDVERQALKSLMLDIYRFYQKTQKQPNSKQFTNLLIDAYKLLNNGPLENKNLVDLSMKYCQALKQGNAAKLQKQQAAKAAEIIKVAAIPTQKPDPKPPVSPLPSVSQAAGLPKISAQDMAAALQNYMPLLNDPLLTQQAAAALSLSYLSNISATMALQNTLQSSLQYSLQNSFQAEFYRQCVGQSFSPFNLPPPKKQKRGPKASSASRSVPVPSQPKIPKPISTQTTSVVKAIPTSVITSQKSAPSLTPSMGTVLPTLPASMTANLPSFGGLSSHSSLPAQAHMSSASTVSTTMHQKPPLPHQQVSPGKTLQEKLAERQKNLPSVPKAPHDTVSREISQSISRLPSSLTITKTTVPKQPLVVGKKPEAKKSLPFSEPEHRPKPIASDEIIILDDD